MKKTLLVYGSTTGETEAVAGIIEGVLKSSGADVTKKDVRDTKIEEVLDYEHIFLGSSTWGCGDFQEDFEGFYNTMDERHLKDKKVAVFGCGDKEMFPDCFCEAVNLIQARVATCGGQLLGGSCKIDSSVGTDRKAVESWVSEVCQQA